MASYISVQLHERSMTTASLYLSFEHVDLLDGAGVRLPYDGDDVDLLVNLLHDLHVKRLQSVSCGGNEVEAGVNPLVSNIEPGQSMNSNSIISSNSPLHPGLGLQVAVKLVLNVVHDGVPALAVVHGLTEPGSVNDSQREFYSVLN